MAEQPPLILVVEDEYALQAVVEEALIEGGFATDILSSAEEALTLFKSGVKAYRALVADVNLMGSLSGWDLARRIREGEPTFPVIYMTGAASDEWASQGVPNSILLQKPFAPAQLVTAVSQLLNQNSAAS
ncbi:response regulator [Bradyrhizobium sp. RT6a]|uniref:response regulator n=1 Tax=unclassified Bradyrhizobium TaxID=2631580 RepID=UPI0033952173